jgi:hypothetical protein
MRMVSCGFLVDAARRRQRSERVAASQTAGKKFAFHDFGRSVGAMREYARRGLYLLILLAAAGVAGWIVANWAGAGELMPDQPGQVARLGKSRPAARSSRATADSCLPYLHQRLQIVDLLLLSASPLTLTFAPLMRAEKDLLSLTQQRRE